MNIIFSQNVINSLLDEKCLNEEIISFLNEIIDEEIEKESPDVELVEECTNVIYQLQYNEEPFLENVNKLLKIISFKGNDSRRKRRLAAAVLVFILAAGALLQTNPAIAEQTRRMFSQMAYSLGITAEKSERDENVKSLYGVFSSKPKYVIKNENEINLNNITVYAVLESGDEIKVPISKCDISKTKSQDDGTEKVILTVAYKGAAFSLVYTIEG